MSTLDDLVAAVQEGDQKEAVLVARQVVAAGVPPQAIVEALTAGMREVGDRFSKLEIYLPELMLAARAMQAVMAELKPEIEKSATPMQKKGVIVIGTVEGDVHEIGKDIAISMLKVAGFEVYNLGANVNPLAFVRKAEEVHADIIGASALMTTTMPNQKEIIEILKQKGLRDKYHVILGGAPVTLEWVNICGADSWGENAAKAIQILERVMAERSKQHAAA